MPGRWLLTKQISVIVIAAILTLVFFPVNLSPSNNGVPTHATVIQIPPAASFQQTAQVFVPHTALGDATVATVPASIALEWNYNYSRSQSRGVRVEFFPSKIEAIQGSPALFITTPIHNNSIYSISLAVFMLDPLGVVQGVYPKGALAGSSPSVVPSNLNGDEQSAFTNGSLAFRFNVPDDTVTQGTWTIFVFATGSTRTTSTTVNFLASNVTRLIVAAKPAATTPIQFFSDTILPRFATFGVFTGPLWLIANFKTKVGPEWRKRLRNNLPTIAFFISAGILVARALGWI